MYFVTDQPITFKEHHCHKLLQSFKLVTTWSGILKQNNNSVSSGQNLKL